VISGRYLPEINQCKSSRSMHTIDASIAGNERKILVQYIESAITMLRLQNWNSNSSSVSFERLQCFINRRRSSKCLSHTWNTKKRSFFASIAMQSPRQSIGVKTRSDDFPPERTPYCRCNNQRRRVLLSTNPVSRMFEPLHQRHNIDQRILECQ
jgi:hypothetical protein